MRKVKTCKKSLGTDSTLAGFPSPEQLNVTAELRTQAPDNSRAAGAAAEKSRAGWRGSFQQYRASMLVILQQYLPKLSACPLLQMLRIAENFSSRLLF